MQSLLVISIKICISGECELFRAVREDPGIKFCNSHTMLVPTHLQTDQITRSKSLRTEEFLQRSPLCCKTGKPKLRKEMDRPKLLREQLKLEEWTKIFRWRKKSMFCGRNIVSQSPAPVKHRECLRGRE